MIESGLIAVLLLGVLVAAPLLLRRARAAAPDGIRVVSRTALHKHAVVAVVAVGGRRLLVGAGEQGVQLLVELDPNADHHAAEASGQPDATTDATTATTIDVDRRDVVDLTDLAHDAPSVHGGPALPVPAVASTTAGPGIGLVDRLRAMTVRTPAQGRPIHVPFRR